MPARKFKSAFPRAVGGKLSERSFGLCSFYFSLSLALSVFSSPGPFFPPDAPVSVRQGSEPGTVLPFLNSRCVLALENRSGVARNLCSRSGKPDARRFRSREFCACVTRSRHCSARWRETVCERAPAANPGRSMRAPCLNAFVRAEEIANSASSLILFRRRRSALSSGRRVGGLFCNFVFIGDLYAQFIPNLSEVPVRYQKLGLHPSIGPMKEARESASEVRFEVELYRPAVFEGNGGFFACQHLRPEKLTIF